MKSTMIFTMTHTDPLPMNPGGLGPEDLVNPFHIQTEIVGEEARQAMLRSAEMMRADAEANRKNG